MEPVHSLGHQVSARVAGWFQPWTSLLTPRAQRARQLTWHASPWGGQVVSRRWRRWWWWGRVTSGLRLREGGGGGGDGGGAASPPARVCAREVMVVEVEKVAAVVVWPHCRRPAFVRGGGGGGGGEGGGDTSPPSRVCTREVVVWVERTAVVIVGSCDTEFTENSTQKSQ